MQVASDKTFFLPDQGPARFQFFSRSSRHFLDPPDQVFLPDTVGSAPENFLQQGITQFAKLRRTGDEIGLTVKLQECGLLPILSHPQGDQAFAGFFAFPLGDQAIVKTMEITSDTQDSPTRADDNELLEMVSKLAMQAGWLTPTLQKLSTLFVEDSRYVGPANKVFANHRTVRFNEMEYTVPAEQGIACLEEVCAAIRQHDINVFFPIEFRYVAADDNLLSMFHQQSGASLSIHQYFEQDYQPLFDVVEPILRRYAGRPHWGKLHTLGQRELREMYPAFDRFQAVRRELDPQGRMLNQHLQTLFGATG